MIGMQIVQLFLKGKEIWLLLLILEFLNLKIIFCDNKKKNM